VGAITGADGIITYNKPGDGGVFPRWLPQPGFSGGWHFPNYNLTSGFSPSGKQDAWGTLAANSIEIVLVGDGHLTLYVTDFLSGGVRGHVDVYSAATSSSALGSPVAAADWTVPNSLVEFDLSSAGGTLCYHLIVLEDGSGNGGGAIGFGGFDWAPS
jgi:hypothetical protein